MYQWCGLRSSVLGQDRSETKKVGLDFPRYGLTFQIFDSKSGFTTHHHTCKTKVLQVWWCVVKPDLVTVNVMFRIDWNWSTRWLTVTISDHNILMDSYVWLRQLGLAVVESSSHWSAMELYWTSRTLLATRCYIPSFCSHHIIPASINLLGCYVDRHYYTLAIAWGS